MFITYTVTIWIPNKSGIQMVQMCLVIKWSGFWMVVWKLNKKVCFMVKNVQFWNGSTMFIRSTEWQPSIYAMSRIQTWVLSGMDYLLEFENTGILDNSATTAGRSDHWKTRQKSVRKVKCLDFRCLVLGYFWYLSQKAMQSFTRDVHHLLIFGRAKETKNKHCKFGQIS